MQKMFYEMRGRLIYKQNYQQVQGCEGYKDQVNDFIYQNEDVDWTLTKLEVSHVFEYCHFA
jgi:hypothetical protein